jgi:shikimate kinase
LSRPGVVLVGIPGSGKSVVGELLAAAWRLPLLDTDLLVAQRTGETPAEAFATPEGETRFRDAEQTVCVDALSGVAVVALGSGAVESAAVRDALDVHRVVWLQAGVPVVTRRLGMNRLGIPALAAIRTALDAQLAERARWYEAVATEVIGTDRLSPDQVVAVIESGARGDVGPG